MSFFIVLEYGLFLEKKTILQKKYSRIHSLSWLFLQYSRKKYSRIFFFLESGLQIPEFFFFLESLIFSGIFFLHHEMTQYQISFLNNMNKMIIVNRNNTYWEKYISHRNNLVENRQVYFENLRDYAFTCHSHIS